MSQDKEFFTTFFALMGGLTVFAIILIILAGKLTSGVSDYKPDEIVLENIKPVGQVYVAGESEPEAAADIPKLGKGTPNVEDILTYEPDLVLLSAGRSAHQELADVFDQNGIQYLFIDYNNFEECLSTYQKFCQLTDRSDLFESQGLKMQEEIKSIVAEQGEKEFTYLLLFATSKSVTTKDDNIASEIINECGGINIAEDGAVANEESKQFSLEKILEMDPDYIFVQTMGTVEKAQARLESDILSNPAWNGLSAVQGDRYLYLPKELFLYKPNMKYPDAYQTLVDMIHE